VLFCLRLYFLELRKNLVSSGSKFFAFNTSHLFELGRYECKDGSEEERIEN
jgi:hypothetical protein